MSKDKELNLDDIVREASYLTGFTQKDIKQVADAMNTVSEQAIAQGYSIKNHKLFKITLETKEGYTAYNGFNDKYYDIPDKQVVKFKPLTRIEGALEELNNKNNTKNEQETED